MSKRSRSSSSSSSGSSSSSDSSSEGEAAQRAQEVPENEAPAWIEIKREFFESERDGTLHGPQAWKEACPVVGRRGGLPDEIFSAIRGCGALGRRGAECDASLARIAAAQEKLLSVRHCLDLVQIGWRPFLGAVPRLPGLAGDRDCADVGRVRHGPTERVHEVGDFDAAGHVGSMIRRVSYRVRLPCSEHRGGIEVKIEVNVRHAFSLMLHCLRYPTAGLEGDWRVVDGRPNDLNAQGTATPPFKLLDNSADEASPQPPHWSDEYPLRPEQRRSLHWMIYREAVAPPLVLEFRRYWRRFDYGQCSAEMAARSTALEWSLDCRVGAAFETRGGVLADEIGYGKTAVTIGLVDSRQAEPLPPLPKTDEGCFFVSKATLICVPSHLHQQWVEEIHKFTDKHFKLIMLRSGPDMAHVRVRDLAEADVVLCNYQLLRGAFYEQRRLQLVSSAKCSSKAANSYQSVFGTKNAQHVAELPLEDLRRGTWSYLQRPHGHAWSKAPLGGGKPDPADALRFPVLEQFFWRRVVFDEFHELEALQSVQRQCLQFLRAHYRWGLTGTPSLAAASHVTNMAALLRVDVAGPLPDPTPPRAPGLPLPAPWDDNSGGSSDDSAAQVMSQNRRGKKPRTSSAWVGDEDRVTVENCCRFLDACVRQNTAQLPRIRLVEHIILVRHTAPERALYLAAVGEIDAYGGLAAQDAGFSMRRNQRLLILCSHFSAGALDAAADANAECGRVLLSRQKAVATARVELRHAVVALEMMFAMLAVVEGKPGSTSAASVGPADMAFDAAAKRVATAQEEYREEVAEFFNEARREASQNRSSLVALTQGLKEMAGDDPWKRLARRCAKLCEEDSKGNRLQQRTTDTGLVVFEATAQASGCGEEQEAGQARRGGPAQKKQKKEYRPVPVMEATTSCTEAVDRLLGDLLAAVGRRVFLQRTLSVIADGSDRSMRCCSICYQEDLKLEQMGITPCAHVFCMACLREQVKHTKMCGICRHELKAEDVRPLMLEMEAPSPQADTAGSSTQPCGVGDLDERLTKYGTKLGHVAKTLQLIKAGDAYAKCIVFCQWDALLRKVAAAFKEFGIRFCELRGNVYSSARAISDFKDADSGFDVLLLSLEQSASGSNLACANHVLFVHPMNATTQEQAVAFELQAIGRVRRWGQPRPEVHVWRFCTAGTVEEEITRLHMHEIGEREPQTSSSNSSTCGPVDVAAVAAASAPPGSSFSGDPSRGPPAPKSKGRGRVRQSRRGGGRGRSGITRGSRAGGRGPGGARGSQEAEDSIHAVDVDSSSDDSSQTENAPQSNVAAAQELTWACSHCTLHNSAEMDICGVCESPRPSSSSSSGQTSEPTAVACGVVLCPGPSRCKSNGQASEPTVAASDVVLWACQSCPALNPSGAVRCSVCQSNRDANLDAVPPLEATPEPGASNVEAAASVSTVQDEDAPTRPRKTFFGSLRRTGPPGSAVTLDLDD